ncbi:hypothetical protein [Sinorhizobium meliloti]|uniref:Uncharacterized protein n=1 Tax=Sinorhizobium meliloti CCNWSX0020 TaxID=1107881 RepID=H0FU60_RHIML|nr:hypothetical protein [Sinorhizobium meliloti]AIM01356.1 hypothetical protein DU99_18760 [Sinorhizobium meliloti]ASQ01030.1 hypothetical protein CDO24_26630 [Sinorhizobium meliloti]EHK79391.1 hypothetical protein SM0020_03445 [Sinorhizobium meliloti CCNWSX0020]WGI76871.1 hypothetical protein QC756_26600 [Sinorhizobium meliloti]WQO37940.1 hypothetical protein U8C34_00725 [Sinorhizobium meliloti]
MFKEDAVFEDVPFDAVLDDLALDVVLQQNSFFLGSVSAEAQGDDWIQRSKQDFLPFSRLVDNAGADSKCEPTLRPPQLHAARNRERVGVESAKRLFRELA